MYHSRHNTSAFLLVKVVALHRVRLARTCLPVGHDGAVKTLQDVVEDGLSHFFEHFFLGGIHLKNTVEHEADLLCLHVLDDELSVFMGPVEFGGVVGQLFGVVGSEPAKYLNIALDLLLHYNQYMQQSEPSFFFLYI